MFDLDGSVSFGIGAASKQKEEAQGFFQGQKSLEHVVGIISNRLNLLALE